MFSTDLKFAADCLLKWFNKKFKLNYLELTNAIKRKHQIEHSVNWSQDRCCLCPFPLKISPTSYEADGKTMSYAHFTIFKEHKFLENIFSSDELAKTDSLKDLKTFHERIVGF